MTSLEALQANVEAVNTMAHAVVHHLFIVEKCQQATCGKCLFCGLKARDALNSLAKNCTVARVVCSYCDTRLGEIHSPFCNLRSQEGSVAQKWKVETY
jgi:hypothetical protein